MNYIQYKKIEIRKKLLQIVSLQMKIKNYFITQQSVKDIDSTIQIDYYVVQIQKKLKELKKELRRLR